MKNIIISILLPEKYYNYVAKKCGWQEVFLIDPQSAEIQKNPESDVAFCQKWLKNKIFSEIIKPEYLSARAKEITEIETAINADANKILGSINVQ